MGDENRLVGQAPVGGMDRGYAKFALFNKIVNADRSYVCHLRHNSVFVVTEVRSLSDADRTAS